MHHFTQIVSDFKRTTNIDWKLKYIWRSWSIFVYPTSALIYFNFLPINDQYMKMIFVFYKKKTIIALNFHIILFFFHILDKTVNYIQKNFLSFT